MRIVIAGAGEVGIHLAKLLANESQDIFLIDGDQTNLDYAENHIDVITVRGDATCPKVLKKASIEKADLLIAATSTEASNITIAMLGKRMGAKQTVSRITNTEYLDQKHDIGFEEIGVDFMISPELLAAKEIERLIRRSAFTDCFQFDNGELFLVGIKIDDQSPLAGKLVEETSHLNPRQSYFPVAIQRAFETIIPRGNSRFESGDYIYFIAKQGSLDHIVELTGRPPIKVRNVMVLGGSRIGVNCARDLSDDFRVKLMEQDREKIDVIAEDLPNVLIINGDGRNVELLEEESIGEMDVFVAVTGNSATNIMSCLVARKYGVKKTIALVENIDYIHLSQNVGIDTLINKKLIAANNIFRHVRKGEVLSLASLHGVEAEILEFGVQKGSKITKKPIRALGFPKQAIIGGVIRDGKGLITLGDFHVREGDHVVVFTMPNAIHQVEKFFA